MKITNAQPYMSVGEFTLDDMPDFVVIIGPNGSGKSQLLRGIEEKKITVTDVGLIENKIIQTVKFTNSDTIGQSNLNSLAIIYLANTVGL